MTKFGVVTTPSEMKGVIVAEGAHVSNIATYVSATGTAGSANTAQTVITRTLAANSVIQNGDRIRIRVYFFANSISPILATCKLGPAGSEVSVSDITHSGGSALSACWNAGYTI